MDPSFSYAAPGQTFTTPQGEPLAEVPDNLRHKVTFTLETERYDMLSYLSGGLYYTNTLEYTFTTAELVGQPVTLKHLVSRQTPPMGCMIFCWTHYTYIPYLRVGDSEWIIEGRPFWELLSDYPFGQFAITAEWLHFDVKDADGHTRRYTRQLADRLNVGPRTGPLRGPRQISAAGVLQAASAQNIPLVYVDAEHLESLAQAQISTQAKARIVDAAMQGYGVLVPERMVTWDGQPAIAWWQLDLKTGEVVDVNEDGTHQFLVIFTAEAKVLIAVALIAAVLIARIVTWHWAVTSTWTYFWQTTARLQRSGMRGDALYLASLAETKKHMKSIRPWLPLLW